MADSTEFWPTVFKCFRPEDQESLIVAIQGGMEIAVQAIARVEEEMVMIRGRVAGQAESGRLFLLPYDKINGIYVNRMVTMLEVELYSPTVSMKRKEEVARMVVEMKEKEREMAKDAERAVIDQKDVPVDLKAKLEALRQQAGLGIPTAGAAPEAAPPPAKPEPAKQEQPKPEPGKADPSQLPLPPRFNVPKPPKRPS